METALLADEPRVGKTGTAIMACDDVMDASILTITTASGRAVWERAWHEWSPFERSVQTMLKPAPLYSDVVIVGWDSIARPNYRAEILKRRWDRVILDESHHAKTFEAARTRALYGTLDDGGLALDDATAIMSKADGAWSLTGTPIPNAPNDLYPMMRAQCPERLAAGNGFPDVMKYRSFLHRYCVVKRKNQNGRPIEIVVAGKNKEELRERLRGFILRRTQADVGITQPVYETFPLVVSPAMLRAADGDVDRRTILAAAEAGDTKTLKMHMGPLRRLTGTIKAPAVAAAVAEELDGGLDKIVVAFWHHDVGDILENALAKYGVVRLDGSTVHRNRATAEERFHGKARVFLGQIQAAGEAIDLSPAAELICAETSLIPKDMRQMALRITNYAQARLPRVRVATLRGSIDEAMEGVLLRKWSTIRTVLGAS